MKCTLMASIVFLNVNNKHKRIISANAHFKIKLQNTNKNSFLVLPVTELMLLLPRIVSDLCN
jgi:hypothetical protein